MPANKNFVGRIRIIDNCLSGSRKYWTKEELLKKIIEHDINAKERTIEEDFNLMRNSDQLKYYAPIKYCKIRKAYHYTDPNYSIDKFPLNEKDIEALEFAATTLLQYQDVTILNDFAGVVDKLINVVNHIKDTDHETQFSFIDFEKAPFYKGQEHLNTLVEKIKEKKLINMTYHKFDKPSSTYIIFPLLLKEYRNRWYLLGHDDEKNKISTFALDRIEKIEDFKGKSTSTLQINFTPEKYFKNTLGITYESSEPVEIVLSFSHWQGNYIKTQHLHETQQVIIDDENELQVKLLLTPNYEFYSTILSYGNQVKVIRPEYLAQKIKEKHKEGYLQYN